MIPRSDAQNLQAAAMLAINLERAASFEDADGNLSDECRAAARRLRQLLPAKVEQIASSIPISGAAPPLEADGADADIVCLRYLTAARFRIFRMENPNNLPDRSRKAAISAAQKRRMAKVNQERQANRASVAARKCDWALRAIAWAVSQEPNAIQKRIERLVIERGLSVTVGDANPKWRKTTTTFATLRNWLRDGGAGLPKAIIKDCRAGRLSCETTQ